jgi:tetratricopeptide (TPR) repeat protein
MPSSDLFKELGKLFPASESVVVLSALRQEPLVWRSLEQPELLRAAAARMGEESGSWSPARIALLALGDPRPVEALRAEPMALLGPGLQELALQAYQNLQRNLVPPNTLRDAALLALTLRERRRLTGTWVGMLAEILPKAGQGESIWRAPLAILYGLIPDPEEMLRSLLGKNTPLVAFTWAMHIQLSQPFSDGEHVAGFSRLLHGMPVGYQLNLLRALSLYGREALAAKLADHLLLNHPAFIQQRALAGAEGVDLTGISNRALALQQIGTFYHIAGDGDQALSFFNAARATLEQWQAGLHLQRLNLRVSTPNLGSGPLVDNDQSACLAGAAGWMGEDLGAVMISHPYASSVINQVLPEQDSHLLQLKRAALIADREPAVARDMAKQAASGLVGDIAGQKLPLRGDFVTAWQPKNALRLLIDLRMHEEALALADALLEFRPTDLVLLGQAAQICETLRRYDRSVRFATAAAALDPLNPTMQRELARLWGEAGNWDEAYTTWQVVLTLTEQPQVADQLACAQSALSGGRYEQAAALCQTVLVEDDNNGVALGLLGQALFYQGEPQQALSHLVRATLLAPDSLSIWLALAKVQQELGEPQRALETLRAAVTAVPEVPQGHVALAKACINAGLLADALPHLKKAVSLSSDGSTEEQLETVLLYGQTLRRLGHTGEARAALERARASWPIYPELAYEYALTVLDLGEVENAIPVLESALRCGLPVLEAHLLYARILLGEYGTGAGNWDTEVVQSRMQQADVALRRILELEPDHLEARFLMADILREKGDLVQAMDAYRALTDLPVAGSPELRWRIQWGLGRTAIALGEIGTALAAIKEACQERPDSLPLQRSLAEVSLLANLPQEALSAADNVLQLAPDDVNTLGWYAGFVARSGESRKAVEALERAVQLDPHRADLHVALAHWLLTTGDLPAARESLEHLREMENASRDDLRTAAQIYLRLEDRSSALQCFERALRVENGAPADLLFEVARLYERTGDYDSALELVQQAAEENPTNLPISLLHVDLLVNMKRPQAALALLERALRVTESWGDKALRTAEQSALLGDIHERFTRLMLQEGSLPAALDHAEQALSLKPDAGRCFRAADLALALLQNDRAARLMRSFAGFGEEVPVSLLEQGRDGMNLYCLYIETALVTEKEEAAARWVDAGMDVCPGDARLMAARSRVLAGQGDLPAGQRWYEQAQRAARKEAQSPTPLWLAEAALAVEDWAEAYAMFDQYVQANATDARAQLGFARVLVLSAEKQWVCEAAGCTAHAPGAQSLDEEHRQKFEDAIRIAGRMANVSEVGRWQCRGQVVFAPSSHNIRSLAAMPAQPDDTAALIAALRFLNNRPAALQVGRRYSDHPQVLLQLALCYLGEEKQDGLAIAERLVAQNPNNALHHVVLAMMLRQARLLDRALEAYEKALTICPGEPLWHEAAGDLCIQQGSVQAAVLHRQQAVALDAESSRAAFKLGQALLASGDTREAINWLEKSCAQDANQADVWLALASAYYMAGSLPQAMEAAKQASGLDQTAAEGLLIAGETAMAMNQSDLALDYARGAVRREPENAAAVLFLSSVLSQRGRPDEGLAVLEAASQAVRAEFPVAFERGKLIHRLHGASAAVDTLEKLARDYPEEPGLLGYLAQVEAENGDMKSAEHNAFKALKLDPGQPELTLMLGRLLRKTGQLDQAVHMLSEAIRMTPNSLEAYLELGSVYQERREIPQALQVYTQAMRIAPADFQAYYQSGVILRDSKDYPSAETMLRRAAELAPENLSIRRQLVGVITLNLVHNSQEEVA